MKPYVHLQEPMIEGEHYRRLSAREGKGRYRFALLRDVTFIHPCDVVESGRRVSFRDEHHHEWMSLTSRTQTIRKDYWWNGNSPKRGFSLLGLSLWVGTPDFQGTIPASGKHDPDFQFSACEHYPFSLTEVNIHYYQIARTNGAPLAHAYHGALKDFSHAAWRKPNGCYSILI